MNDAMVNVAKESLAVMFDNYLTSVGFGDRLQRLLDATARDATDGYRFSAGTPGTIRGPSSWGMAFIGLLKDYYETEVTGARVDSGRDHVTGLRSPVTGSYYFPPGDALAAFKALTTARGALSVWQAKTWGELCDAYKDRRVALLAEVAPLARAASTTASGMTWAEVCRLTHRLALAVGGAATVNQDGETSLMFMSEGRPVMFSGQGSAGAVSVWMSALNHLEGVQAKVDKARGLPNFSAPQPYDITAPRPPAPRVSHTPLAYSGPRLAGEA